MVECAPCVHGCPAADGASCCGDEPIPVLTLWEPWASAVGRTKWVETRSWAPRLTAGADLLIAASASRKPMREIAETAPRLIDDLLVAGVGKTVVPFGHIVSRARLVDAVPTDLVDHNDALKVSWRFVDGRVQISSRERRWGDFTPGRWAWLLRDVRHFDIPVPFSGGRGLSKRVSLNELQKVAAACGH